MYGDKKIISFILASNCYLSHYISDIEKRNYIFFKLQTPIGFASNAFLLKE